MRQDCPSCDAASMLTTQEVLAAARVGLLGEGSVTDGWRGLEVELVEGQLWVVFTWRQLPYRLGVRAPLTALDRGIYVGEPVDSAQEWVDELAMWLMEEVDTGAVVWAQRVQRGEVTELLMFEPWTRQFQHGPHRDYYTGPVERGAARLVREQGLDPTAALEASGRGELLAWWVAYVNNSRGLPVVAQLVVTGADDVAHLQSLEVRHDLPTAVPDMVIVDMVYMAAHAAACQGALLITCDAKHPALVAAGLLTPGDQVLWRADGHALAPPLVP